MGTAGWFSFVDGGGAGLPKLMISIFLVTAQQFINKYIFEKKHYVLYNGRC